MEYTLQFVDGHIEVLDARGRFLFSADNQREALEEVAAGASRHEAA